MFSEVPAPRGLQYSNREEKNSEHKLHLTNFPVNGVKHHRKVKCSAFLCFIKIKIAKGQYITSQRNILQIVHPRIFYTKLSKFLCVDQKLLLFQISTIKKRPKARPSIKYSTPPRRSPVPRRSEEF